MRFFCLFLKSQVNENVEKTFTYMPLVNKSAHIYDGVALLQPFF
jgi:hypothetical protein